MGQLGDNSFGNQLVPTRVALPRGVTLQKISLGGDHSCGVTQVGEAYCWGSNIFGQLGVNSTRDVYRTPQQVQLPENVSLQAISAGENHTCGLTQTGIAYCWGWNYSGEVGNESRSRQNTPVRIHTPSNILFRKITAGNSFTCAIAQTGDTYCWGGNSNGQLGVNSVENPLTIPTRVQLPENVRLQAISAGEKHTCAITQTGDAYCWGFNLNGQLGNNLGLEQRTPTRVELPSGIRLQTITTRHEHNCGISQTGTLVCWGYNGFGQLGISSEARQSLPTTIVMSPDIQFTAISTGNIHTCAATVSGSTYCWGYNANGELGVNLNQESTSTPTLVLFPISDPSL
jgi:alpha-tubulin suppressor-like RCC1 family protein